MTTVITILVLGAILGAVGLAGYVHYHRTKLPEAIRRNDVEGVERALNNGASVGPLSQEGTTPLHLAAQYRRKRIARLLLDREAEPNAFNGMGQTPLHWAAEAGRGSVAAMLVNAGADPEAEDRDGVRPIHAAAAYGSRRIVRLLADEERAAIDPRTEAGATPLLLAAQNGHTETILTLLRRGANPAAQDRLGRTPLSAARSNGHEQVVELLEQGPGASGRAASG